MGEHVDLRVCNVLLLSHYCHISCAGLQGRNKYQGPKAQLVQTGTEGRSAE